MEKSMLAALSVGCLTVIIEQLEHYRRNLDHLPKDFGYRKQEFACVKRTLETVRAIRADKWVTPDGAVKLRPLRNEVNVQDNTVRG